MLILKSVFKKGLDIVLYKKKRSHLLFGTTYVPYVQQHRIIYNYLINKLLEKESPKNQYLSDWLFLSRTNLLWVPLSMSLINWLNECCSAHRNSINESGNFSTTRAAVELVAWYWLIELIFSFMNWNLNLSLKFLDMSLCSWLLLLLIVTYFIIRNSISSTGTCEFNIEINFNLLLGIVMLVSITSNIFTYFNAHFYICCKLWIIFNNP